MVRTLTIVGERALPLELFFAVLDYAQYDDLTPRYRWLRRYALVCRAWRPYAQQLLFRHVTLLKGADHCKSFHTSLAAAAARSPAHAVFLASAVRTLSMALDHQAIYADVAAALPALRELHLSLYHASFRPAVLHALAPTLRRVRTLRVRAYHYVPLFQLLALARAAEFLDVDCSAVLDPALEVPAARPPPWRLRELRYANLRRDTHAFVAWALSGPARADALEALRVVSPTSPRASSPRWRRPDAALARRAPSPGRRRPARAGAAGGGRRPQPAAPAPEFGVLPAGVRHVALDGMSASECETALASLAEYWARSGGGLRVVTYNRRGGDKADELADVEMLYKFCVERNHVQAHGPAVWTFAGENTPLGEIRELPREVPLSSKRYVHVGPGPPWKVKPKGTLVKRVTNYAVKALTSTAIPPMALARP
ncbi:uncharacterized protein BXZ73DRAFT_104614 [Epithele typhae]|uniref:uncharacterized protein n=1 Tax=Epithele typhae TaxID=378194 RepID=UPI0020075565|nr:uncharacterized protein BXZ73DRAFT_104614 [Epithele typhae]KAH9920884.1 hypothetical protein BXZ73DRAFT_104614 [Epithele typhae]